MAAGSLPSDDKDNRSSITERQLWLNAEKMLCRSCRRRRKSQKPVFRRAFNDSIFSTTRQSQAACSGGCLAEILRSDDLRLRKSQRPILQNLWVYRLHLSWQVHHQHYPEQHFFQVFHNCFLHLTCALNYHISLYWLVSAKRIFLVLGRWISYPYVLKALYFKAFSTFTLLPATSIPRTQHEIFRLFHTFPQIKEKCCILAAIISNLCTQEMIFN